MRRAAAWIGVLSLAMLWGQKLPDLYHDEVHGDDARAPNLASAVRFIYRQNLTARSARVPRCCDVFEWRSVWPGTPYASVQSFKTGSVSECVAVDSDCSNESSRRSSAL